MSEPNQPRVTGDTAVKHDEANAPILIPRPQKLIFPGVRGERKSMVQRLMKAAITNQTERSLQGTTIGVKQHPFDFVQASLFMTSNTHHSAAIKAKQNSTMGLGFLTELDKAIRLNIQRAKAGMVPIDIPDKLFTQKRSKVAEVLDPLCAISFQDTSDAIGEDLASTHNGYFEIVRKDGDGMSGKPTGLYHLPACEVKVHVENLSHDFHYEITSKDSTGGMKRFARFGDKPGFMERETGARKVTGSGALSDARAVSEVIHLRYPSSISKWYGIPTWLSAVAAIELVQALHQHEFDFYNNRGVPEFLLFLLGKRLSPDEWAEVRKVFESTIGLGNTRKSGAFNFDGDITVQLEKLAMEGKSDGRFTEFNNSLALNIVSGHRIPPLLAGITIPGKLGASNELPNALMAYQTLTVAPDQATIQATLGCTLGSDEAGLGLTFEDFELKTILDVMDLGNMDTVARMRETVVEAEAEGRSAEDGLKKSMASLGLDKLTMAEIGEVFAAMVSHAA